MAKGTEVLQPKIAPTIHNDTVVTRVGRVIRRYSIDDLPQLNNIANGEMSLVGPRPQPIPEYTSNCAADPLFEEVYCSGLPGLTGLAQINGRKHLTPEASENLLNSMQ